MYAIRYKNNPLKNYYYTPLGKLYYVDIVSKDYPKYPYYAYQYKYDGTLVSAIYYISNDTQYFYKPNGEFKGVWYKNYMYNAKGKKILSRSNY